MGRRVHTTVISAVVRPSAVLISDEPEYSPPVPLVVSPACLSEEKSALTRTATNGERITFWPDWDPNIHIRPDEVRQANFGTDFNEISRTTVTYTATDQLVSATEAAKIQASGNIRINSNGGNILNQSSTMAAT